jgi:hypothetical protein
MSYVFPSVTINYVTYTAKRWGQFPTITYRVGAGTLNDPLITAGNEVVTLVDDPMSAAEVVVKIESGVSTNAQIAAAIAAAKDVSVDGLYAKDLVDVAITSGHNADTNTVVSATPMTGGSDVRPPLTEVFSATDVHADIPSTIIATPMETGLYQVSFYGLAATAPSGADAAPNLYISWTDEKGTQTYFNFAGNLDQTYTDGPNSVTMPVYAKAGTPITFRTSAGVYSGSVRWSFYFAVRKI